MIKKNKAVVIGGGFSGFLSAKVLSQYFRHVVILEKDNYENFPEPRKGTPQAIHYHVILTKGLNVLEKYFPSLRQDLEYFGVDIHDPGLTNLNRNKFGFRPRASSGLTKISCSRSLLDMILLNRIRSTDGIELRTNCEAIKLSYDFKKNKITGVVWAEEGSGELVEEQCDLVIDCSGKRSRAGHWIREITGEQVEETLAYSFSGYATQMFKIPEGVNTWWKSATILPSPPKQPRGLFLSTIEEGQFIVSVTGGDKDYPPATQSGLLKFIDSLGVAEITSLVEKSEPLSNVHVYRATENRIKSFDKLSQYPNALIVAGDAACALNPVYGQGLTLCALSAQMIDNILKRQSVKRTILPSKIGKVAQKKLNKFYRRQWDLVMQQEMQYAAAVGPKLTFKSKVRRWIYEFMLRVASQEPEVSGRLLAVENYLSSPICLFHPKILFTFAINGCWSLVSVFKGMFLKVQQRLAA